MKRTIENTTLVPIIVAGHMIPPGQSRDVDIPDELASSIPDGSPAPADPLGGSASTGGERGGEGGRGPGNPDWPEKLVQLQKLSVAKLKAELDALSTDELGTLAQIEEAAEQPRTSVLEALAAAQLKLARKAGGGDAS